MSSPRRRRPLRRVALIATGVLAVGLVGVPSALGSAWLLPSTSSHGERTVAVSEPEPLTSVPADDPGEGLVHKGLRPGGKGTSCAGEYEVIGTGRCSHGPDEAPPGLSVK
jgi:hypothetical protein